MIDCFVYTQLYVHTQFPAVLVISFCIAHRRCRKQGEDWQQNELAARNPRCPAQDIPEDR